jgi:hypothetical protein
MKHMLPMIIITIAVFAFCGLVIYNGDLKIGKTAPASTMINIERVAVFCSEKIGDDENAINILMSRTFQKWLTQTCNNRSRCDVNIRDFYTLYKDVQPECSDELRIKMTCVPSKHATTTDVSTHEFFLYEGQQTTLSCS